MKRFKITFNELAQVITVSALVLAGFYGIYLAGKSVTILPTAEFDQIVRGSLEADADTAHALKAQGRE